jgi:hypothetical protein
MSSDPTDNDSTATNGAHQVIDAASIEARQALGEILALEREYLRQKTPNASELARRIAGIIREVVP